ncbi:MAG TPA: hypothetical protein VK473_13640 [Terriglobales bacterium]|nr:hypothetical protein [Terriglobales bacterium]
MNSLANFLERREHPRGGVMAQLEDLAYCILRKHGVVSGPAHDAPAAESIARSETGRDTTMAILRVIIANDHPEREDYYPSTWLLYKHKDIIQIHVGHDNDNRPFVFAKGVA